MIKYAIEQSSISYKRGDRIITFMREWQTFPRGERREGKNV